MWFRVLEEMEQIGAAGDEFRGLAMPTEVAMPTGDAQVLTGKDCRSLLPVVC